MLRRLEIKNYALIESVELEFGSGFTAITGETGSGKSIMLGALSLLMGQRADSRTARGDKARVQAIFENVDPSLRQILTDKGIDWIESIDSDGIVRNELSIRREITSEGRSRVYINDTSVTLATLTEIGPRLIDIHSQSANSKIADNAEQLKMVDAYVANSVARENYRQAFAAFVKTKRRIAQIKAEIERNRANEQVLRFQCEQLDKLKPKIGELAEIERRYEMLSDADEIKDKLTSLRGMLGDSDGMLSALSEARQLIDKMDFNLFGANAVQADIPARMEILQTELKDISATIEDIDDSVDTDPATLRQLSDRMKQYYDAVKYFRVADADALVALSEQYHRQLDEITYGGDEIPELEREGHRQAAELKKAANVLTNTRKEGAAALGNKILERAVGLGLPNLRFEIPVTVGKLTSSGQDNVEFMCGFNRNGEMKPIGSTASGGEMSRLMLSLKSVVAERLRMPTMIFDEVDTGVSGEIADKMGAMMHGMGSSMQVMAITHLPQVAARGDDQFKVYKQDEADRTVTHVSKLSSDDRVREIASMISGSIVTAAAEENARILLDNTSK